MKLRLVLVVLLFLPLLLNAQQEDPNTDIRPKKDVIFYSKGKMYVKYNANTPKGESSSTTLYIDGSAKFATHSAVTQKGRTELTGDFINEKDPSETEDAPHLFTGYDANDETDGVFAFVGGTYKDAGNNDRATRQWILGSAPIVSSVPAWTVADQKTKKFINFPTLSVEKAKPTAYDDWRKVGVVTVDTTAAVGINFVKVDTGNKNRFAVRAAYTTDNRMSSGYALIRKEHSSLTAGIPLATYSQVDFKLYNFARDAGGNITVDDGKFSNDYTENAVPELGGGTLRANKDNDGKYWNRLIGFTPPFAELAADYMFYHVLTKPDGSSVTSGKGPIVDPYYKMQAGVGYFMTMELSHSDHIDNIDERWDFDETLNTANTGEDPTFQLEEGIHHTKRARGGYVFNRMAFEDYASAIRGETANPIIGKPGGPQENFRRYTYDPANVKTTGLDPKWEDEDGSNRTRIELLQNEKFNTSEVEVKLTPGLNFVGNPFMAPISLNCLLGLPSPYESNAAGDYPNLDDNQVEQFNVDMLGGVSASSTDPTKGRLRTKYWLIDRGYARYDADRNMFLYSLTYNFVSRFGATAGTAVTDLPTSGVEVIKPEEYLVAPMQMFALQASDKFGSEITIKLNPGMRAFGQTRFQKSTSYDADFKDFKRDWFVVEVQDEINKVADRTSVIFKDDALLQTTQDVFDTKKGLNDAFDSYAQNGIKDINGFVSNQKQDIATTLVYTKSSDNVALLGNAVPKKTKELPLFFDKPEGSQPMKLKFYGIENIEAVQGVWLVDRCLDNKVMEVSPGFEYTFESASADTDNLPGGNRFILRFYPDDKDVINKEDTPIVCYYNSSMLYVKGLIADDTNSDVVLYDMQGRLMAKTKINSSAAMNGTMEYLKPLSFGTYIVKITGKRNHTAKFVNLQTK